LFIEIASRVVDFQRGCDVWRRSGASASVRRAVWSRPDGRSGRTGIATRA